MPRAAKPKPVKGAGLLDLPHIKATLFSSDLRRGERWSRFGSASSLARLNETERDGATARTVGSYTWLESQRGASVIQRDRKDLFASLVEFDLKDIPVILEIRVVCKDGPSAS